MSFAITLSTTRSVETTSISLMILTTPKMVPAKSSALIFFQ